MVFAVVDPLTNEVGRWGLNGSGVDAGYDSAFSLDNDGVANTSVIGSAAVNVTEFYSAATDEGAAGRIPVGYYSADSFSVSMWARIRTVGETYLMHLHNGTPPDNSAGTDNFHSQFLVSERLFDSKLDLVNDSGVKANFLDVNPDFYNTWMFLTYVQDGTNGSLYINGSLVMNNGTMSDVNLDYANLTFANIFQTGPYTEMSAFCGRYFNAPLSSLQVKALYANGEGNCSSLQDLQVALFDFAECVPGTSGNISINFTIVNESYPSNLLTSNLDVSAGLFSQGVRSDKKYFNLSLSGQDSYAFCLREGGHSFLSDIVFSYTTPDGYTHNWYLNNYTLSNVTDFITASNFDNQNGVSDLRATVRDRDTYREFSDVYASLERNFIGSTGFKVVQMDRSSDFGSVFFHVFEGSTEYRVVFRDKNNTLLRRTDPFKLGCTSSVCELTFLITGADSSTFRNYADFSVSFDNSTKIVTLEWNDPNEETTSVTLRVTKETFAESILICSEKSVEQFGSLTCDASSYAPPFTVAARREASPEVQELLQIVGQSSKQLADFFNDAVGAGFLAFITVLTSATAGLRYGGVGAGASVMAGLFIIYALHLFTFLNAVVLMTFGVGTAIVVYKIK